MASPCSELVTKFNLRSDGVKPHKSADGEFALVTAFLHALLNAYLHLKQHNFIVNEDQICIVLILFPHNVV